MDTLTKAEGSERMSRVRAKDSKAELVVRRIVYALGYRYRLHRRDLPGTPDLVFGPRRKVIFVHGCFWHRHPDPECKLARMPKSNLDFWEPKLEGNRERDIKVLAALSRMGWRSFVAWECQIKENNCLEEKLREYLAR